MRARRSVLICLLTTVNTILFAQHKGGTGLPLDGKRAETGDSAFYQRQHDLVDISLFILHGKYNSRSAEHGITDTKIYISAAPVVEYTIATGFSPGIAGNLAKKSSVNVPTNTSSLLGAIKYTQKKQLLLPFQTSYWTPGNRYNLLGDWRFLNYVQDSYGLGGNTLPSEKYTITYKYIRFYETLLKQFSGHLYGGVGYQLDYHWKIREIDIPTGLITDFQKYGYAPQSSSSGLTLLAVYDSRENSINPEGGAAYAKLQFLQNTTLLGSTSNSNSVIVDLRKYFGIRKHDVLALWFYSSLTISGNPPYLDLPGTGSDTYNNVGRGYEQNRYTGKELLYVEAEYRFGITRDGLVGGVLFSNVQSVSEPNGNTFRYLLPGAGFGLRIKFNKFSRTNACIDYGYGIRGSRGFVGNLGEVF